ncbi:hypothetical protein [Streptomyces kanamyceticus]|uniref:hypothetical protein n=1 Tax=Streptomyces kanamyceticus TaxID=1967 RepID=UPI0037DC40C7
MSDIYAFDLALDLAESTPDDVLAAVRWHLGQNSEQERDESAIDGGESDLSPLWGGRGAALRIGGVLWGSLVRGDRKWSLGVRQEIHAEDLEDLKELVERLTRHAVQEGAVGQTRFHEDEIPDLLCNRSGRLIRLRLREREEEAGGCGG